MAQPAKRAATYEDLVAVPEHLVAEILLGELVTHPRPAPQHAVAASALQGVRSAPFQFGRGGPGGWIFMEQPELHLGKPIAVPDVAGWRHERLPQLPETAWIETPPDWIWEILSPSTERYDRGDKRIIYAEAGVPHVWHVIPTLRMLETYELRDGKWLLLDVSRGDREVAAPAFPEVGFPLSLLWPCELLPAEQG